MATQTIVIEDLDVGEIDELIDDLFDEYLKEIKKKRDDFRSMCCSDGEYETWKFEQWAHKKNHEILPTILAFDEKHGEDYGTSFASPFQR
jgi:hypothetical protein